MPYDVKISQTAFVQINEAVQFVNNVSREAAIELYQDIMAAAESLKELPLRYPTINFLKLPSGETRKMNVHNGRYAFLYSVVGNVVNINYFVDLRQKNNSVLL